MPEISNERDFREFREFSKQEKENFREIKPDGDFSYEEAKSYWDNLLGGGKTGEKIHDHSENEFTKNQDFDKIGMEEASMREGSSDPGEEVIEGKTYYEVEDIKKTTVQYFEDLKDKSECSETIPDKPFDISDLKKRTPEENAEMREEFSENKAQLKREWEEINGRPWPKYEHDVYSTNGKLIRKAGSDYDAHHILPLGMGGKNEAKNITPLHAEVHYDKQGVHSPDSPYSKLDKMLGGMGS